MSKKIKAIIAATLMLITISSTIATAITTMKNNKNVETIYNLEKEIKEISEKLQDTETQSLEKISELNSELEKVTEELECARRNIKELTRMTYFNPENVTHKSNTTINHMNKALKGTELQKISHAFVEAEQKYNINAYFLAALAAQESSWGNSQRAIYQKNITGFAVYNNLSRGSSFSNWYECLMYTAKTLRDNYLTEGAIHYNGLSTRGINTMYCFLQDGKTVDYRWSENINSIAKSLRDKANSR